MFFFFFYKYQKMVKGYDFEKPDLKSNKDPRKIMVGLFDLLP